MMLVLGNGRVVTRDASCPFIEDGAVAVEDTKIRRVGKTQDIRSAYPDAEYIDAKGGLIMPAFINVHEHIYSSFARGLSTITQVSARSEALFLRSKRRRKRRESGPVCAMRSQTGTAWTRRGRP